MGFLRLSRLAAIAAIGQAAAVVAPTALSPAPAVAQDAPADAAELLDDLLFYISIGNHEIATGLGAQLLGSIESPVAFVELVESSQRDLDRFDSRISEAQRVRDNATLRDIAGALADLYAQGRLDRARDPDEIKRNIRMLREGGVLARSRARQRLVAAGEYAMPYLFDALMQGEDATLRQRSQSVMIELGSQSIMPLVAALPKLDPARQELVILTLEKIPYRQSAPFIAEIEESTSSNAVRAAARRALAALQQTEVAASVQYLGLAERFADQRRELTSFPDEEVQLVWIYEPAQGLNPIGVPTPIYHEIMAMRLAERSLSIDPAQPEAVALWVGEYLSREIELPESRTDPLADADRAPAEFFAVASGPDISRRVLRRSLDDADARLARRAIAALERTAGSGTMVAESAGDRRPLVDALSFPSRRVRYEAALAIARSQPDAAFPGAEQVVPILAGAVRDAATRIAVVFAVERETYALRREQLETQGYTVLPMVTSDLSEIGDALSEVASVDLVLTDLGGLARTERAVERLRGVSETRLAPVIAIERDSDLPDLRARFAGDQGIAPRGAIGADQLRELAEDLVRRTSGDSISDREAADYAIRSLDALRDLAVSRNGVLSAADAASILIPALDSRPSLRSQIADVLASVNVASAQLALAEAATDASDDQQTMLNRLADSAKRFGKQIDDRYISRLIGLTSSNDEQIATASAAVLGALDIEAIDLVPLMVGDQGDRGALAGDR